LGGKDKAGIVADKRMLLTLKKLHLLTRKTFIALPDKHQSFAASIFGK